jgi:O-acetyl-ADP-ribose deacetylase (regulator of RNase III)
MIKEVEGDILLTKAEVTAHGVSPDDDFKNGLALSIRERWPALYKDFRHYCHTRHPKPGTIWAWAGAEHTRIINLLTQEPPVGHGDHPGPAKTKHVNHALRELRKEIDKEGITSIALPKLACGVGGLEWNEVRPLIDEHLGDLNIPVILYTTYKKDVQAEEGI